MRRVSVYRTKSPTRASPKRHVWQLRWYGTDGKRYCKTIGETCRMTKRDALSIRRDQQSKIDCGVIPVDQPKRITLSAFVAQDRATIEADVRATTLLEYDHAVAHAYRALGKEILLDRIGPVEVGRLKKHLKDLGRAPATIRKTVKMLGSIMRRAKDQGLIQRNPFAGQAKGKTQSKRMRIFSPTEVNAMLAVCPNQWWLVFLKLAVTTGLRKSELLNLQWADVDFDAGSITVARKDAGRFTVSGQSYPILAWETKAHEERSVPLPAGVADMLRPLQLRSGGSRYVFLSLSRLAAIDERMKAGRWRPKAELVNNLNKIFKAIQRVARRRMADLQGVELDDVPWTIGSIHDLRRTYATEMATHVDLLTLCRWLGHADPKTTGAFYHQVKAETEEKARRAMAKLYSQTDAQLTRSPSERQSLAATGTETRRGDRMNADCACSSIG